MMEGELSRVRDNMRKLASVLKPMLESIGLSGIDIIDTETGEVLSD